MKNEFIIGSDDYTQHACNAALAASRTEHDFAGWLASVLAGVAAELGSSDALTAGRPGSWEAKLVQQLVKGTVGWGDEYLADYGGPLR
jgi:fructose-1-phosphate kinase PfkB-like protein